MDVRQPGRQCTPKGASQMKKDLFRGRKLRTIAVLGAAALPFVVTASANADGLLGLGSTSLFATAQGTSILGIDLPVLGTQGYTVTLPVGSNIVPGEKIVFDALDFTVAGDVKVGNLQVLNLYLDPHMTD